MECEPPVGDLPMTTRTASSPRKITERHDAESEVWDQQMNVHSNLQKRGLEVSSKRPLSIMNWVYGEGPIPASLSRRLFEISTNSISRDRLTLPRFEPEKAKS